MKPYEFLPANEVFHKMEDIVAMTEVSAVPRAAEIMRRALKQATSCWVLMIWGKVACVYGIQTFSLISTRAYIWALTTKVVDEHKFIFIRQSRIVIEKLLEEYDPLIGETHINDLGAQRWLRWLGAEYDYPKGELIPFRITKGSYGSCQHRSNGSR